MEEGSPFVMFMYDSSTGETFSVENTWFTGGIMNDASAGYTNNGLYPKPLECPLVQWVLKCHPLRTYLILVPELTQ